MTDQRSDNTTPDDATTFDAAYVHELRGEAASHRARARDLEQQVDELQGQVDTYREREVDRAIRTAATDRLADPDDLTVHVDRDSLLTDDGDPNPDAIETAIDQLIEAKPHLRVRPQGSADGGSRGAPAVRPPSFGDFLRG